MPLFIARLMVRRTSVCTNEHDVVWFEDIGIALQFALNIGTGDGCTTVFLCHIEDHSVTKTPAQGNLIDRPCLTRTSWSVMRRRINVGARVGGQGDAFCSPAYSIWPGCRTHPKALFSHECPLLWRHIVNPMGIWLKGSGGIVQAITQIDQGNPLSVGMVNFSHFFSSVSSLCLLFPE